MTHNTPEQIKESFRSYINTCVEGYYPDNSECVKFKHAEDHVFGLFRWRVSIAHLGCIATVEQTFYDEATLDRVRSDFWCSTDTRVAVVNLWVDHMCELYAKLNTIVGEY